MENKKRHEDKTKKNSTLESLIRSDNDDAVETYKSLNWTGTFWDYIKMLEDNPKLARNSYQRLYDMVMSHGTREFTYCKRKHIKYKFFDDLGDIFLSGLFSYSFPLHIGLVLCSRDPPFAQWIFLWGIGHSTLL